MIANYQLRLKDDTGNLVAIVDDWRSLSFSKIVNEVGSLTLTMNGMDAKVSLFALDGQLEVWRRDIGTGVDWYIEWEGFLRTFSHSYDDDGNYEFSAAAVTYNHLLKRRIVGYQAGSTQSVSSGAADDAMKQIVRENLGSLSTVINGRVLEGAISGFSVQADSTSAPAFDGQNSFKNVFELLLEISKATSVDFDVVGVGDGLYEFMTFYPTRGNNLTTVGLDVTTGLNSSGNYPVVFNPLLGNMGLPTYEENRSDEVTFAIIGGQGTETDRNILVLPSPAANDSVLNQIEVYSDSKSSEGNDDLDSDADTILADKQQKQTFEFTPLMTPTSAYANQYYWGDFVTAQFGNLAGVNKRVLQVDITVGDDGKEDIKFTLAEYI